MTAADFQLPAQLDYLAIFAWALSGAIVGLRKRYDLVGVFVTALLTSIGGGICASVRSNTCPGRTHPSRRISSTRPAWVLASVSGARGKVSVSELAPMAR